MNIPKFNRLKLASQLGASFEYQQRVISCLDRYRVIKKCRQAGMTTALAIEALIDALTRDNFVICIVSPTNRQSARMMRYIKQAFAKLEAMLDQKIPTEKWTQNEVFFHHGSEILSLPNNPDGIQGVACDDGKIDEAGLFSTSEGEAIIDAIVGSLAAKHGRLTVSGRPRGKRGLLWQYFDPHNTKSESFTKFNITWQDRAKEDTAYGEEVLKHKQILTKLQFDEIYNAEFVDEGVLLFSHELLEKSIDLFEKKRYVLMYPDGHSQEDTPKYVGIDFGRRRDLTEIHVIQREEDGIFRTCLMKSLSNMNFENQKIWIDGMIARIKPRQIRIDERGMGLPLLDYFVAKHGSIVQPLKLSLPQKEKIIVQLQNAFMDGVLAIPDDDKLYEQLHSFQKEFTDYGNIRYTGKVDETDFLDDKVIALAAAVDAAKSNPFKFTIC